MASRDVFDVFKSSSRTMYKAANVQRKRIRTHLWNKVPSQRLSDKKGNCFLRSIDYDLDYECFSGCKRQGINSLFFNFISLSNEYDYSPDNFFILNFVRNEGMTEDAPMIVKDSIVEGILREGICVGNGNGVYNIVGCSNSQVQNKSFYFMLASKENCKKLLEKFIPDLDMLERTKGVAKRTKYAGLLFTGCQYIVDLPEKCVVKQTKDKYDNNKKYTFGNSVQTWNKKYNFTDGCGFISYKLAHEIWKNNEILNKKWKRLPSVWQIRYCGHGYVCKGVLIVNYEEKEEYVITIRPSLIKVQAKTGEMVDNYLKNKLGIVTTSDKTKIGKLNKQVVALLSVNVSEDVLLSLQEEYLKHIENARENPIDALHCYALRSNFASIKAYLRHHEIDICPGIFNSLPSVIENIPNDKLQVPLACARLLLGATFPEAERLHVILKEGQCVVLNEFGYVKGPVVVCRSPSYAPGDIQVLEAIALQPDHPISYLRNVILFSTQGDRPDADKMSGGDLDGDLYLVIWDKNILKFLEKIKNEPVQEYDPPPRKGKSTVDEDYIRYIALWENSILAQIDCCFFRLACEKGVKSQECLKLCELFSRAVDQHASDLKELRNLLASCSSRSAYNRLFVSREEDLPIWERMFKKQERLWVKLKERDSKPCLNEWRSFYEKLVKIEKTTVVEVLQHKDFEECTSPKERMKVEEMWSIICSNMSASENLQQNDIIVISAPGKLCGFDCTDSKCPCNHPFPTDWKQEWSNIMRARINYFIEPFKRELKKNEILIIQQDRLLRDALHQLNQKCSDVERQLRTLNEREGMMKDSIRNIKTTIRNIKTTESHLDELFSRAVDQHASDLKELRNLLASCSSRSAYSRLFVSREEYLPIWERMFKKQEGLCLKLKERDSKPSIICNNMSASENVQQKYELIIIQHDRLLRDALHQLNQKCSHVERQLRTLNETEGMMKDSIRNIKTTIRNIKTTESHLDGLKEQLEPDVWKQFKNWCANTFLGRNRILSIEEKQVMAEIKTQEDIVVKLLSSCLTEVENYLESYDYYQPFLYKMKCERDEMTGKEYLQKTFDEITNVLVEVQKESQSLIMPKIDDVMCEYQVTEHAIAVSTSKIEEAVIKEKEKREYKATLQKQFEEHSHRENILLKKKQEIECSVRRLTEIKSKCSKLLNIYRVMKVGKLSLQDVHKTERETLLTDILGAIRNHLPDEIDVEIDAVKQMFEKFSTELKQVMIEKERKNCEYEKVCSDRNKIKELMADVDHDVLFLNKEIENERSAKLLLKESLKHIYDQKAHKDAIEQITSLSFKTKSFDLALCALLNEVNFRFRSNQGNERAALNRELQLCLSRETKRCEKEVSDNRLPVFSKRCELLEAITDNDVVIVVANTGSGKSTQIPQYLADDLHHVLGSEKFPKIVCTQPRRVAAMRIADRVSQEYAGAVCVSTNNKSTKTIYNSHTASVVAYPLYASLGGPEQDRALDESDRVGPHIEITKEEVTREEEKEGAASGEDLRGTPGEVGGWVGYHIGSRGKSDADRKNSKKCCGETRIEFVTEGLLVQKLRSESEISNYQCIIIDEAHERGIDTDLLLARVRKIVCSSASNIKFIVMSASINHKEFSDYFGGCPVIECEGRMFEVEEFYKPFQRNEESETALSLDESDDSDLEDVKNVTVATHAVDVLFNSVHCQMEGDVIIFLPGMLEIHTCVDLIKKRAEEESYGKEMPKYVRKVVCCTNIAETSLTIPGVRYVIDAGKAKKIAYDHELRVTALQLQDTSQASAKQRKGRAGRVQPGKCYRLYSDEHFAEMRAFDEPEMKQCSIDELYLYALDVFGVFEELELMYDAQPDAQSLQSARERLLNLNFIEEDTDERVNTTDDGKLALMLKGDVSLEGTKMIIASREYGIVRPTLKLAVLLQLSSDIFMKVKDSNVEQTEKQNQLLDELGDHMTLMNVYDVYEKKEKKSLMRAENWCIENGLVLTTLRQAKRSIDSVYQTLKRYKMLGRIMGKDESRVHFHMKKEELCKVIVSGFFHNIVELHDKDYMKAGYSLITPQSRRMDTEEIHLLKVHLSKDSALQKQGDVVENTYLIFNKLFKIPSGKVLMLETCRIRPEFIIECASQRWKESVGLSRDTQNDEITSLVRRQHLRYISPHILGSIAKIKEPERYLKKLETESGAAVNFMFDAAEIRCYGSQDEIVKCLNQLQSIIKEKKREFQLSDQTIHYPYHMPVCDIQYGMIITKLNITWAIPVYKWDLVQSRTIMFRKIPSNANEKILSIIKQHQSNVYGDAELRKYWGTPEIICSFQDKSGVNCCKVKFQSDRVARYVVDRLTNLRNYGLGEAHCFTDTEHTIPVISTNIYPSVFKLAGQYTTILAKETQKGKAFSFKLKPKQKDESVIYDLLKELTTRKIFVSSRITDIDLGLPDRNYRFINEQLFRLKEKVEEKMSGGKYKIYLQTNPRATFEVSGDDRERIAEQLNLEIKQLRNDVVKNKFSLIYYREHKLQRHQMNRLLHKMEELKGKHTNVSLSVITGRSDSNSDKTSPTIELLSRSRNDGERAFKDVMNVLLMNDIEESDAYTCVVCKKMVVLKRGGKTKIKGEEGKQQDNDVIVNMGASKLPVVSRLTLCGCIYCSSCLEIIVLEQVQKSTNVKVECVQCREVVLIRDLFNNFSKEVRNKLYKEKLRSYLKCFAEMESRKRPSKVITQECVNPTCKKLMVHSVEKGVYCCPNDNCHNIYCLRCGARVYNEMMFNYHIDCRCSIK